MIVDDPPVLGDVPVVPPPQPIQVGRIVHYIVPAGSSKGEHFAAIIVKVNAGNGVDSVNLHVFHDGSEHGLTLHIHSGGLARDVLYNESKQLGTWHWPERV